MKPLLFWALLLTSCGSSAPPAASAPPPAPVQVEVAGPAALERAEEATGALVAIDSVEIRPETSGVVEAVLFEDGAVVRKGQVLVQLRDAEAQAGLLDATARQKLAGLDLGRAKALFERGDIAAADLDRADAAEALARAAVQKAEEAVRRTRIRAPFDGSLGLRAVSPGQTVDPSRVLARIDDTASLAVDLSLPESALARVALGQPAQVSLPSLGEQAFPGKVTFVAPHVREDTRTVDLRVTLDAPDPRLRPGQSARVRVVTARLDAALLVPSQAVVPTAAGPALWVVGADQTVALHPVVLGERSADRVEVSSGLAAGEAVVVQGLARLRPGAAVAVAGAPSK